MMSRNRLVQAVCLVVAVSLFIFTLRNSYRIKNTLSYATRPLWDNPDGPKTLIKHYASPASGFNEETCRLHHWQLRERKVVVWDAVIISSELDLLEIRLHETKGLVDKVFVLESDRTFTGLEKPTSFANERSRFSDFEDIIVYELHHGRQPDFKSGESAFDVESEHRNAMTRMLHDAYKHHRATSQLDVLVIMSDVDEIPSRGTIDLIRHCSAPEALHLQLRNYLYSFEWFVGLGSWRAAVHKWQDNSFYRHSKSTEDILTDAGWHCSFCFRTLPEFVQKMKGYSHWDRIGGDTSLLRLDRIQDIICSGADLFGMLPEAYTFKDLVANIHPTKATSAIGLPTWAIQNPSRFRYLLLDGCKRDR